MHTLKTNPAIQTLETNPANHLYPEPMATDPSESLHAEIVGVAIRLRAPHRSYINSLRLP